MYCVSKDLNLDHYVGRFLTQVGIGEFQIQFNFHPDGLITVDGRWELIDSNGQIADYSCELKDREKFVIHSIIGKSIIETKISPPEFIEFIFENGFILKIFDNSSQYESFQIDDSIIV